MQNVPPPPLPPTPIAQAPAAPAAPGQAVAQAPAAPRVLSAEQYASLRARRSELSNQLQSVQGRRDRLARELRSSTGADRDGLEERIEVLDQRIVQIESDMATTGRELTTAALPGRTVATTQSPAWFAPVPADDVATVGIVFTVAVLGPIAVAAARLLWKRGSAGPVRPAPADPRSAERLERIEQAVEAIAIEVERVSEGQRFVTRLLAEGGAGTPALGAGQRPAEPVRVPAGEPVAAGRRGQP